jgi:hypothetical protein
MRSRRLLAAHSRRMHRTTRVRAERDHRIDRRTSRRPTGDR